MNATDPIQHDPFAVYWRDVFVPDVIQPLQRQLGVRALWTLVRDYTGIKPTAVRQWVGAHSILALPTAHQIHRLAVGFDLDDDRRDELWGAWVSAAWYRCEAGIVKKATIGCMETT